MDFSDIRLCHKEYKVLLRSQAKAVPISSAPRLLQHKLTQEEMSHVPGYMPKSNGFMTISKIGIDYIIYYRQEKKDMWMKSAWIPIIVSFVTTLIANYILPMLPLLLEWFRHIFE